MPKPKNKKGIGGFKKRGMTWIKKQRPEDAAAALPTRFLLADGNNMLLADGNDAYGAD